MRLIISLCVIASLLIALIGCSYSAPPQFNSETTPAFVDSETSVSESSGAALEYDGLFPQHEPKGTGVGVMPGRVVWAYDPDCVDWTEGYWWEFDNFDYACIQSMVDLGITATGGTDTPATGWDAMFRYHNETRGKSNVGYVSGEKIAIKANMNGAGWSGSNDETTANVFTNPVALRALLVSMVEDAGIPADSITVYDASRNIPDYMKEYCGQGVLAGIHFLGIDECEQDRNYAVKWSESFSGETCFLPTCVTEAEYLINFADLKGHSLNSITLTAKNHFGTIMNSNRDAPPLAAGIHRFVTADSMGNYTVLVDLMANYLLEEKTILYLLDGIIVAPGESATTSVNSDNTKWQSAPFNGDYTSSLFFSQDPVAIDSVGADFLCNEPTLQQYNSVIRDNPNAENYLHEAGGVANAPSGTVYYDGNGNAVNNIGVHEHWNNCTDKQYSRNLCKYEGIELIQIGGDMEGRGEPLIELAESTTEAKSGSSKTDASALVVYYSYSGNTKRISERLADLQEADIYEIRTVETYPDDPYETSDISLEERSSGKLPELMDDLPDITGYTTIYIGGPIWNSYMATPLESYLEMIDFSGKTVVPFSTSMGSGQTGYLNDFRKRVQHPMEIAEYLDVQFPNNGSPDAFTLEEIDELLSGWMAEIGG